MKARWGSCSPKQYAQACRAELDNDARKASGVHATQAEAIEAARRMLENSGGGERTVQSRKRAIRSKDTIPPGHDVNPPNDKEH